MGKRFLVTHIDDDSETILGHYALADEVFPSIIADAMASDVLADHDHDTREAAIEMVASMQGLESPPFPRETEIYGRKYRIDELPDTGAQPKTGESVNISGERAEAKRPIIMERCIALPPSKLRYEIWPNESQHRGRPHCRVSCAEKSANFSVPEGERLVGDVSPHEREAATTIRKHGTALLDLWHRMRPDDQKL